MTEPLWILASASPRRAAILRTLGLAFEVRAADIDERLMAGEAGASAAERLARAKAARVANGTSKPVLAADTLVLCDHEVLGKPADADEARRMLRRLAGRAHEVVTGVCLSHAGRSFSGLERTAVTLASLDEAQIDWYVATGEPMDKAGAYHVDGLGALFITAVAGSPSNVAGLPIRLVGQLARAAGLAFGPP
jgi:septum formation protein